MWFELVATALIGYLLYFLMFSEGSTPTYWQRHGIKHIDSSVVATNLDIFLGRKNITERDEYAYKVMGSTERFCGMTETPTPVILVKDLDIVKKIMIKDFDHFVNRRDFFFIANPEKNIISRVLGSLKNDQWRGIRISMTPAFTSGKIRRMMEHFNSVSQELVDMLKGKCAEGQGQTVIDVLRTVNQYIVEVIATTVFGMQSGSIQDPQTTFFKMASRLSELKLTEIIKLNLSPRYPKLFQALGIEVFDMNAVGFFENLLRQSLEARLNGTLKRNDFQQLLIESQKGQTKAVGSDELNTFEKEAYLGEVQKGAYLTNDVIVANSVVFFVAGLQATSAFITFAVYVLAANPDIQDKLEEEVDGIVKEDGNLDYDELGRLTYLDMFANEVLRHYPLASRLEREANKDYHDPESGLFVPKGTVVVVPVTSIHFDPEHYPNPKTFNPENFSAEAKARRSPYAFMPFGIGPRNCIGMRFALVESKAAIAKLVHHFKIEPSAKTPLPVYAVPAGIQLFPPKDLEVKLTARHTKI